MKLVFFKMIGCTHCIRFYEEVWPMLISTKIEDISEKVLVEHGPHNTLSMLEYGGYKPVPDKYQWMFNDRYWGPAFLLDEGKGRGIVKPKGTDYSYDSILKWIADSR
jgi:hypothetical protein